MARTDTLGNFLTDVADAIRTKTGSQETIQASSFDTAIGNIPSGADLETKSVTITENTTTTITPTTGKDGMSEVTVTTNVNADVSEYLDNSIDFVDSAPEKWQNLIKKFPTITINVGMCNNTFYSCLVQSLNLVFTTQVSTTTYMFCYCSKLTEINATDFITYTTNLNNTSYMFQFCDSIKNIPQFNTSKVTDMHNMFNKCLSLETLPDWLDTSSATNLQLLCSECGELKNVPVLDLSKAVNNNMLLSMFYDCKKLTDTSLDNILQSCATATNYSGTKKLTHLGISNSSIYSDARIQALPHYQDFIDAGWVIR